MHERFETLSMARRRLVTLMQEIGHGRIEAFPIANGEPVLDPIPRVVYELRVLDGSKAGNRSTTGSELKTAVVELLRQLTRAGNGLVAWIEIRDGLPVRVAVERPMETAGRSTPFEKGRPGSPVAPRGNKEPRTRANATGAEGTER